MGQLHSPYEQVETSGSWPSDAVVGERYRLMKPIGAGAMGEVWRAMHIKLHREVALKLVSVRGEDDGPERLSRFLREAQAAARLKSPHVVQIFDHDTHGSTGYIAMELLEGESLGHRLDRLGCLTAIETARIAVQTAAAVGKAHEAGIVHRDLKPENIFMANEDGLEVVKILDFGIAKITDLASSDIMKTKEGIMVGTPSYMSPEQILGTDALDGRSDLWQLAVVVFECLSGALPFESDKIGELLVKICSTQPAVPSELVSVPDGFDAWFAKALQTVPDERFQTAGDLVESLVAVLTPHMTVDQLLAERPAVAGAANTSNPFASGRRPKAHAVMRTSSRGAWSSANRGRDGRKLWQLIAVAVPLVVLIAVAAVWSLSGDEPVRPAAPTETAPPVATTPDTDPPAADGAGALDEDDLPPDQASSAPTPSASAVAKPAGSPPSKPAEIKPRPTPRFTKDPAKVLGI